MLPGHLGSPSLSQRGQFFHWWGCLLTDLCPFSVKLLQTPPPPLGIFMVSQNLVGSRDAVCSRILLCSPFEGKVHRTVETARRLLPRLEAPGPIPRSGGLHGCPFATTEKNSSFPQGEKRRRSQPDFTILVAENPAALPDRMATKLNLVSELSGEVFEWA